MYLLFLIIDDTVNSIDIPTINEDAGEMMSYNTSYGQFCPLAMAADFLCQRWTMLVLREFLLGSQSFNDISRGVARMSRTLLSKRLKELEGRGLVTKQIRSNQRDTQYKLTTSGESLGNVVFGMAEWSQEWLHTEPSLENIDADHLFWSLRRSARPHSNLPSPFVVHIFLSDQPKNKQNAWLLFEDDEVELCINDHGFEVDVQVEALSKSLTKVYLGWSSFSQEIASKEIILHGDVQYTKLIDQWFGKSRLANIKKQPENLRVF
jgi:DNA-binding HxlR family transcriptional regulator